MSVKVVADSADVGYWAFEVTNSQRGTFTVELSRGEKADPSEAQKVDPYDKYQAFVSVEHDGEQLFRFGVDYTEPASLMPYEGNGLVVCSALGCLAEWAEDSKEYYKARHSIDKFLSEQEGKIEGKLLALGANGENFEPLPYKLVKTLAEYDEDLFVTAGQLFLHGVDNTTKEWRDEFIGEKDFTETPDPGDEAREEYAR